MSLKLPRKNLKISQQTPSQLQPGRLRRYSDRMIASCKDLAAECAVSDERRKVVLEVMQAPGK